MTSIRIINWLGRAFLRYAKVTQISGIQRRFLAFHNDSRVTKGLVIGVYQKKEGKDPKLTPSGEKCDDRVQDKVTDLVKECNIKGALGKGKVFNNVDQKYRSIAVIGVGPEGAGFNDLQMIDECTENIRVASGVGACSLQM
ncbi:cytosol aminopeptidase-like [Glossina fuscipes]|uniref:Cytosol aminopeptidase-like n=1 Tax=Glossina fuscipes TaxID=7396 RepID=A0A9C6E370_9MUSC|nr:cytosol aminopeptidase-like [Glossina fuscipes]